MCLHAINVLSRFQPKYLAQHSSQEHHPLLHASTVRLLWIFWLNRTCTADTWVTLHEQRGNTLYLSSAISLRWTTWQPWAPIGWNSFHLRHSQLRGLRNAAGACILTGVSSKWAKLLITFRECVKFLFHVHRCAPSLPLQKVRHLINAMAAAASQRPAHNEIPGERNRHKIKASSLVFLHQRRRATAGAPLCLGSVCTVPLLVSLGLVSRYNGCSTCLESATPCHALALPSAPDAGRGQGFSFPIWKCKFWFSSELIHSLYFCWRVFLKRLTPKLQPPPLPCTCNIVKNVCIRGPVRHKAKCFNLFYFQSWIRSCKQIMGLAFFHKCLLRLQHLQISFNPNNCLVIFFFFKKEKENQGLSI